MTFAQFLRRGAVIVPLLVVLVAGVVATVTSAVIYQGSVAAPAVTTPVETPRGLEPCVVAPTPVYSFYNPVATPKREGKERERSLGLPIVGAPGQEATTLDNVRDRVCEDPRTFAAMSAAYNRDPNRRMSPDIWQTEVNQFLADPGWTSAFVITVDGEHTRDWRTVYATAGLVAHGGDPIIHFGDIPYHESSTLLIVRLQSWYDGWIVWRLDCGGQVAGQMVDILERDLKEGVISSYN